MERGEFPRCDAMLECLVFLVVTVGLLALSELTAG
jgi:hypothetical protein